ncbi:MAG: YggS family pyridoxal phosphate-dependent enzyme [Candidatus Kapaibacterium sp.]
MSEILNAEELQSNWREVRTKADKAAVGAGRSAEDVKVVAVSKTHPFEMIENAIRAGIRVFGENYAQELRDKEEQLAESGLAEPEWHFIGHLQRNKVKYLAPFVHMIHSVDSVRLAREINKEAAKNDRVIPILIQINTSGEESKFGCEPRDVFDIIQEASEFDNIEIKGLMTIGSFDLDGVQNRKEFKLLRSLLGDARERFPKLVLEHLSMGMTHDYELAIEEGATIVRVGTAIFGKRDYA